MPEEVTNPTSPGTDEVPPEEEIELDKTRMDIDVTGGGAKHEVTKTDIRVEGEEAPKSPKKSRLKFKLNIRLKWPAWFSVGPLLPYLGKGAIVFVGLPLILFLGAVMAQLLTTSSVDPNYFSLFTFKAPATFLNQLWIAIILVEIILLFLLVRGLVILKIALSLFLLFSLAGFVSNMAAEIPLESSWHGTGYLSGIPYYFQPAILTGQFIFPIYSLLLLGLLFIKSIWRGRLVAFLNLLIVLEMTALGTLILRANGVPNLATFFMGGHKPVASASLIDTAGGMTLELMTRSFEANQGSDAKEHYLMNLKPHSPSKFILEATRLGGGAVYFLEKRDFILKINGKKMDRWNLGFSKSGKDKEKYLVSVPVESIPKKEEVRIAIAQHAREYQSGEFLIFTVAGGGLSLPVSFQVKIDSQTVSEGDIKGGEGEFHIPLSQILAGDHEVVIEVTDAREKVTRLNQPIQLLVNPEVKIISPLSGDAFDSQLTVMTRITKPLPEEEYGVQFYIDDQLMAQKQGPPYQAFLDTKALNTGAHTLKVSATPAAPDSSSPPLTSTLSLTKGEYPRLDFVHPTLGEYLSFETAVEVAALAPFSLVELFLGDQKIHEWKSPPYTHAWKTSGIPPGNYILGAKGKTESGVQSSDWVEVVTGRGSLKIIPPKGKFDKVALILDGSVSMLETLDGKSKWFWAKQYLSAPYREEIILSGGKNYFSHHDCEDAEWILPRALEKRNPRGVFSAGKSVALALGKEIKKIILLTDGEGSCPVRFSPAFEKKIRDSKVKIDVILMGNVADSQTVNLKKLASLSGGMVVKANFGEKVAKLVDQSFTFQYQLFEKGRQVFAGPLDGAPQELRPGIYSLEITSDLSSAPFNVNVRQGQETVVELGVENGALVAREKQQ